ncbi:MAG TPA: hypothetical protein DDZ65_09115, partial [Firmicutes bacterium]|nr:hypothetical protein [Bacillota bacterium]
INCLTAKIVGFDSFDSKRNDLTVSGVLITKGQSPSFDFEPEYIAVSSDGSKAYIALQENNALAVLDIKSAAFTDVYALGFKDHSVKGNEIYIDGSAKTYKNLLSAYHPDGISIYENNGKTYILTANEGDAREWSPAVYPEDHEDKVTITDSEGNEVKKVVVIDCSTTDGLPEDKNVLAGGRSFSMFEMTDDGIKLAYDSGSDFEDLTMSFYPDRFNSSNDSLELDVTVGQIDDKVFAFVALERIGGVMAYDITNPAKVNFSNYINTRDFVAEDGIGGDSGPEGIAFVASAQSPTGNALLILGCEITGTMLVYELIVSPGDLTGKLVIIHTNDTHGGDVAVKGTSIGTAGIAQLVKDYEGAGAQVLLVSAGDAIQGDPLVNLSNGLNAIKFMNLAGYDLMVPGNHEYDFGYDNLLKLEETADFPFISANILDKATGE